MKQAIAILLVLGLCGQAFADETWVEVSPSYSKPFKSAGYSGSEGDGIGGRLALEASLSPYWALGVDFEQMKIDEKIDNAADITQLGLATLSIRTTPWGWKGARPYAKLDVGLMTQATSNDPIEDRSSGLATELGAGVLFTSADQPWVLDLGLEAMTISGNGLNLLQGHMGILVRFGQPLPETSAGSQAAPGYAPAAERPATQAPSAYPSYPAAAPSYVAPQAAPALVTPPAPPQVYP